MVSVLNWPDSNTGLTNHHLVSMHDILENAIHWMMIPICPYAPCLLFLSIHQPHDFYCYLPISPKTFISIGPSTSWLLFLSAHRPMSFIPTCSSAHDFYSYRSYDFYFYVSYRRHDFYFYLLIGPMTFISICLSAL